MAQKAEDNVSVYDYFRSRLSRLYPHYFLSLLMALLIFSENNCLIKMRDLFWSVFMVQNLGLNINLYNGVLWYVTYLFYAGLLVYILLIKIERKRATILFVVYCSLFYYFVFKFYKTIDNVSQINIVFPLGFYRAIADLLLGVLVYSLVQMYKGRVPNKCQSKRLLLLILSCGSLLLSFYEPHTYFDFLVILCFATCVYISNIMEGRSKSAVLERAVVYVGRKCYCLYCYQIIAFVIVEKVFPIKNVLWVLLVCVVVALFFDRVVRVMLVGNDYEY